MRIWTDIEYLAKELSTATCNCSILFTPKFHCELAGEGIEYSWGASKRYYRRISLKNKKSFSDFVDSIRKSLYRVNIDMARRFSAKARSYMCSYQHQHLLKVEGEREENVSDYVKKELKPSFDQIEALRQNYSTKKVYLSHRDTNTTDGSFIERVMKECIIIDND